MAAQRRVLVPSAVLLVLAAWLVRDLASAAFLRWVKQGDVAPTKWAQPADGAVVGRQLRGRLFQGKKGLASGTARAAEGAAAPEGEEDDSIELSGFSSFVVGLALLPYVINCLYICFTVAVGPSGFVVGPYGLSATSCIVTMGLALWSLGSFVQRGRGLPAGPFGLLGLSEGLAYIGVLGLAISFVATNIRGGVQAPSTGTSSSSPKAFEVKAPSVTPPAFKVPDIKAPEIKAPEFKAPDIKVPDFKVPDFKVPDIKAPAFNLPDVKIPDINAPEAKSEKVKALEFKEVQPPEPPKVSPKKAEPAPPPAPAKAPPKSTSISDYDDLFD